MNSFIQDRILSAKKKGYSVQDDQPVGIVIRYKGSSVSGLVTVTGTNAIAFTQGALGSEAADTNIQVGATPGTIDLSNAAADTFGELVDYINNSTNWEAYLVDVLRADGTNTKILNLSASQANKTIVPSGVRLFTDTSALLNIAKAIMPSDFPLGFEANAMNKICEVYGIVSNNTFGSGTSTIQVYEMNPRAKTETLVFSRPGGATTVTQSIPATEIDITTDEGNYLLVRMVGSAAATGFLTALGKVY